MIVVDRKLRSNPVAPRLFTKNVFPIALMPVCSGIAAQLSSRWQYNLAYIYQMILCSLSLITFSSDLSARWERTLTEPLLFPVILAISSISSSSTNLRMMIS